ncbi:hypothetical protein [Hoeflea sp. TYP-13]|uniref:hypothetical protein n=1 Tax=Hoeflea sp. TYP-13 TaxID=3230023 RepID=UPI0034C5CD16
MKIGFGVTAAGLLAVLAILTGCVSASLEDAAPTATSQPEPASTGTTPENTGTTVAGADGAPEDKEVRDNSFVETGARRNDSFPTFAISPRGATEQLSEEEKQALLNEMRVLRAAQQRGGNSSAGYSARYNELKEIARTHGIETQKEIEE